MKKSTLGLDCGGTNIKMALVDASGKMLYSDLETIHYKQAPESVIKSIAKSLKSFAKKHRVKEKELQGVGVGIAGDVEQTTGTIRFSPNLGWKNVAFGKMFKQEFDVPVMIDNDANCAAWGAYWLDAKRDCKNLVCLTLGTGIGGGIIIDRKLYRGATGSAGEIGHMTIDYHGRTCKCGNFGCIESMVGAWGLIQSAEEGLKKNAAPILHKVLKTSHKSQLSPKLIAQAAKQGDPFCQQLWKDAGEQLGSALANIVNVFNPERIVLCGGVSKSGDLLLLPALHTLGRRAFTAPAQKVKVTISQFDDRLGVVGAALLLRQ